MAEQKTYTCERCECDANELFMCERCEQMICNDCQPAFTPLSTIDYNCCKGWPASWTITINFIYMSQTHELKTINPHFEKVWIGEKTFELRKDDRGFEVGDTLLLQEYCPKAGKYLGRTIEKKVAHILRNARDFGLSRGFCILSFTDHTVKKQF